MSKPNTSESNSESVVVITGASGVVGQALMSALLQQGKQLRVLSRDPERIQQSLPDGVETGCYDSIDGIMDGADAVVHLAARNNDQGGDFNEFQRDNVDLTMQIAESAKRHHVSKFIYATTTKALTDKGGHYGRSKAIAERSLNELGSDEFKVSLARLCPVYGEGTRGKIRKLQNLPFGFGKLALWLVRSLVPIVSAERVADEISNVIEASDPLEEVCISNPLGTFSVYRVFTAIMNFVFVVAVPTVLGLPCLIAGIAVAATSSGGVFFIQNRVGKKKKPFKLVKFRTMFTGTPNAGTHEVGKSYVTKVGAFLRKSKLDELPQAWNVLKREINLIGPRPCLENQTELVNERVRYGVYDVRPGITGFGQVAGVDMSEPRRLAIHDHRYAAFRGILLDIKIALKTIRGGGFGDPVGGDTASASRQASSGPHFENATSEKAENVDPVEKMGARK